MSTRTAKVVMMIGVALAATSAYAEVPLTGYFIAQKSCEAYESFRRETNPGSVRTEPDRAYKIVAKNNETASHYRIDVKGSQQNLRWVAVSCGIHVVPADGSVEPVDDGDDDDGGGDDDDDDEGGYYVLAVSWQPAFCEQKPQKTECVSQTSDRFDASHFTLHGLWPQPRSKAYCGVSDHDKQADGAKHWDQLPEPALTESTREELDTVMPGTQSDLHRHEWTKHGTCYDGANAEEYFADSLALMRALNSSAVRERFADARGEQLTASSIRQAFETSFGAGSANAVTVECEDDGSRELIASMVLRIKGNVTESPNLGALLSAAPNAPAGCPSGIVDEVGNQ